MRLNLHARIEIAVVATLMLGSCARPTWVDRLDSAEVNAANALNRVISLESRVSEIERRLRR